MEYNKIQVLLVEKEPEYSDRITEILAQDYEGVEVVKKTRIFQVDELKKRTPDIILMDPFEGEEDYEGAISELKTLYPKIPIVFITENRHPETIIEGFRVGITDYLLKPFQEDEFKRMFQRVLFDLQSRELPALEGIFQVCQQLNLCRSLQRFFYILALYIAKTLTSKRFFVLYKSHEEGGFEILHATGLSKADELGLGKALSRGETELVHTLEVFNFVSFEILPLPFRNILGDNANYLFIAFGNGNVGKGILGFEIGRRPKDFITPLFSRIEELLKESEVIFSNLTDFLKIRDIAIKDDVTGLYNMRSFEQLVGEELKASDKGGYSVSVLFMDIDDFKKVNDVHGHLTGSKVLKEVADQLRLLLRGGELVFRYGGDEFVVILPATNLVQAKQIGERVRLSLQHHVFQAKEKKNIRLTVSIGVATYPEQAKNITELLAIADSAMYHGKKGSKNVVYVAGKEKDSS